MLAIDNIYNMDCLEGMKQVKPESVDLAIRDIGRKYTEVTGRTDSRLFVLSLLTRERMNGHEKTEQKQRFLYLFN